MADKPTLTELATNLENANTSFEAAKKAETDAIAARKKAATAQRKAQEDFNDAIAALKKKRKSPAAKTKPSKPVAVKDKAA